MPKDGSAFEKIIFQDENGQHTMQYVSYLLDEVELSKEDGEALMSLLGKANRCVNKGELFGYHVASLKSIGVSVWGISRGVFHLFYSHCKVLHQICYLYFHQGPWGHKEIEEVIKRARSLYSG